MCKNSSKCDSFLAKFLHLDLFDQGYQMNIDGKGSKSLPTITGAVVSIVVLAWLVSYGSYRVKFVLEGYGGKMTSSEIEDYFTPDDKFTAE